MELHGGGGTVWPKSGDTVRRRRWASGGGALGDQGLPVCVFGWDWVGPGRFLHRSRGSAARMTVAGGGLVG